LKKRQSAAGAE